MTAYERVVAALEQHGCRKGAGNDWTCPVPAHDDRRPSLGVTAANGCVLIRCGAGCETIEVVSALNLAMKDLFDRPKTDESQRPRIIATYEYSDEMGKPLFEVCRFEPKAFRQRRPDGRGGWIWKLGDVRRVPYQLPDVIEALAVGRPVYIVEGEKDVHAIESAGSTATCAPGGAGAWKDEYSALFLDSESTIRIIADRDEAGIDHARKVQGSLARAGVSAEIMMTPLEHRGADAADHFAAALGLDDFVPLDREGAETEVTSEGRRRARVEQAKAGIDDLLDQAPPERKMLVENVLPLGIAGAHGGPGGAGKGWLAWELGISVATGASFAGYLVPERRGFVFVDVEDARDEHHRRLRAQVEARFKPEGGPSPDILASLRENVRIYDLVGVPGARLSDPLVAEVCEIASTTACPPGLIYLNHLTAMKTAQSLNDDDIADAMQVAARIAHETGALTLVGCHVNKDAIRTARLNKATAISGNVAIVNLARVVAAMWELEEEDAKQLQLDPTGSYVQMQLVKGNYVPTRHRPLVWRRVADGALAHQVTTDRLQADDDRALAILWSLRTWTNRDAWRKAAADPEDDGPTLSKHKLDAARSRLVRNRRVIQSATKPPQFAPADADWPAPGDTEKRRPDESESGSNLPSVPASRWDGSFPGQEKL